MKRCALHKLEGVYECVTFCTESDVRRQVWQKRYNLYIEVDLFAFIPHFSFFTRIDVLIILLRGTVAQQLFQIEILSCE